MAKEQPISGAHNAIFRPCLYIVATPIGNLGDFTPRAQEILQGVDVVACEDTRVTRALAQRFQINTPMISYHDHNGDAVRPRILKSLEEGKAVALVSDAGTPLISDPGFKLVADVREAGYRVVPIPGASALTAAISVAGLPTNQFSFLGFPPQKAGARKAFFETVKARHETLVFYESTRRLKASLEQMQDVFGDRKLCVARELTKKFEEVVTDNIEGMRAFFDTKDDIKGECVILVEGAEKEAEMLEAGIDMDKALEAISGYLRDKDAASLAVSLFGGTRKTYYDRLLALKAKRGDGG